MRRNRDRYPRFTCGHGQGYRPAPLPAPRSSPWHVLAMIVLTGLGISGILWLVLQWFGVLIHH